MKIEHYDIQILKTIEADSLVSQSKLSRQTNINVASVDFALKRLIQKGFITQAGVNPEHVTYHITLEGMRERAHLESRFFDQIIHFYKEVRNDIESRIVKATNGTETSIAIYGAYGLSEIAYMVVSKMRWDFLGFFLEGPKITNEKILGHKIQNIDLLKGDHKCLLLITDTFFVDILSVKERNNVETLNLTSYYSY